jgi:hypothetical protein
MPRRIALWSMAVSRSSISSLARKDRPASNIFTIGVARARTKIGLANIVYNIETNDGTICSDLIKEPLSGPALAQIARWSRLIATARTTLSCHAKKLTILGGLDLYDDRELAGKFQSLRGVTCVF